MVGGGVNLMPVGVIWIQAEIESMRKVSKDMQECIQQQFQCKHGGIIMNRILTEQNVLNKLGISDFRHMAKDKIVKFASMLPYMDPEVAEKALERV